MIEHDPAIPQARIQDVHLYAPGQMPIIQGEIMPYKPIPLKDILNSKVHDAMERENGGKLVQPDIKPVHQPVQHQDTQKPVQPANPLTQPPSMNVHIDLQIPGPGYSRMSIRADITTKEDLVAFNDAYKEYLPRKKWMGLI